MKRIVHFAYLMVWAWVSHLDAAAMRKEQATDRRLDTVVRMSFDKFG